MRSVMIKSVKDYPVSQLFNPDLNLVYEIPKYQREYTWSTRQWEALFEDIIENDKGYYLGSIICIDTAVDPLNNPKREIVDGQQRLTTLSIFFATIYNSLQKQAEYLDEEQRHDLQQLRRRLVLRKTDDKIRVIPQIQNNNRNDYKSLLFELGIISQQDKPKQAGNRRIYKAYYYFSKKIDSYLEESGEENKIEVLIDLLDKMNSAIIVMIEVPSHADAYTLFESLNHRGSPLTAIDLIKNLLLARLDTSKSGNIDSYFEKWMQILNYIGDDYYVQERFFRHNYNAFRKMMNLPFAKDGRLYPLGIIATRTNLVNIYQSVIAENPKSFLDDIIENASLYSKILLRNEDEVSDDLSDSYLNLERIQGAPSYLLLLYILKKKDMLKLDDNIICKVSNLLTNFFVRRNLTDTPSTRDLTRIFMQLVEEIEDNKHTGEALFNAIRERLISCSAPDNIFAERLGGQVYIDNAGATRFMLCALAQKGMTRENKRDLWERNKSGQYIWTIEHIFPQCDNIPPSWVEMIADGNKEDARDFQSQYVHMLGNLTITGYNSTLGTRSFKDKMDRKDSNGNYVGYRNGLNLNADVVSEENWTIEAIQRRTDKMAAEIMEMFRL